MTTQTPPPSAQKGIVSSGWLAADSRFAHADERKVGRAFGVSMLLHGVGLVVVLFLMSLVPELVVEPTVIEKYDLVFVQALGPGGGGGGGNQMPDPPPKLEMKAEVPKPPVIEPVPVAAPPPDLIAPIQTIAPVMQIAGVINGLSAAPAAPSRGTGIGTGAGPGEGPGVGPGTGGGFGGGPMGPGSGAEPPTLLRGLDPKYTTGAMRAKLQGVVVLEALVSATGAVSEVKVIKSLDAVHGLDEEAMRTARQWRFNPAKFKGQPVSYLVEIQMTFNLR